MVGPEKIDTRDVRLLTRTPRTSLPDGIKSIGFELVKDILNN